MASAQSWTAEHLPDLCGKVVILTGANSGIGYEAARECARRGAHVVLACRDRRKGAAARDAIAAQHQNTAVEVMDLDLASLDAIRRFAAQFNANHDRLDVLCNNAGVMALPYRQTADGFEMQIGTNHLGHFALTGLLLERLLATPGARVVTVSSLAHRFGTIRFHDLHSRGSYKKWRAYGQSKLANLLFTYELQRRLHGAGAPVIGVACHPGWAATNLQFAGPRMTGAATVEWLSDLGNRLLAQSAAMGALPTLYAAANPNVEGGDFIGPDGFREMWGFPRKVRSNARSHDRQAARQLWKLSEEFTGIRYASLPA